MAREPHGFKRLVLGLQSAPPDRALRLAVELAEWLDLDVLGLFVEDTSLRRLAGLPFARELRVLGGGWQPIAADRLAHDLEVTARNLERTFAAAVKSLASRSRFEVTQDETADVLGAISGGSDIVMIAEPTSAAERSSSRFLRFVDSAFRSAAAVILVPPRIVRSKGPIVALVANEDDSCIAVAAAIAQASGEELVIVECGEKAGETPPAVQRARARRIHAGNVSLADPPTCLAVMRTLRERMVVMTRVPFDGAIASAIAAGRGVPVLVIEPEKL
jgi:hypothetical protein